MELPNNNILSQLKCYGAKAQRNYLHFFLCFVKGRNLYRMKTYRQPWKNEKERSKVLAEKHTRGAAARLIREMRRTKAVKRTQKISSTKEGSKHQKRFHQYPSSPRRSTAVKKYEHGDKHGKTPVVNQKYNYNHQKVPAMGRSNLKGARKLSPRSSHQRQNLLHPYEDEELVNYDYHPHYGRPTHEWRNFNRLSGLRTNRTSQPFSCETDSSRRRK